MLARRYSSRPINALQVGNPAYAMELKAQQTKRKAKPMTLSSLVSDPFGVSTAQAFYPGKVRSAKGYRNSFSSPGNSSSSTSTGTCSKCSGKAKTSVRGTVSTGSNLSGNSARNVNGSSRMANGSARTSSTFAGTSTNGSGISSVVELDRMSQAELADYVLNLEQQVTQSCGGGGGTGGVDPVSSGGSTGTTPGMTTPAVAQNQAPASSCCCCTCTPSAQTQSVAPPQTIAGGYTPPIYTPPPPVPSSGSGQGGGSPPQSSIPTAIIGFRGIPLDDGMAPVGEEVPNAGVNYTPGYNANPGGVSWNPSQRRYF